MRPPPGRGGRAFRLTGGFAVAGPRQLCYPGPVSTRDRAFDSILVYVGLDLVGDGLIKLPFVRALRAAFPAAEIVWLAGKGRSVYAHELAPLVRGLLDLVVEEAGWGAASRDLLRPPLQGTALAGRRFDLVIDTQRRVRTCLAVRRIPHRSFVSPTAGYLLSDLHPPSRFAKPPSLLRQLFELVELASGAPARPGPLPPLDRELRELAAALLPEGPRYVGLAPGAGARHKCWPLARFLALAAGQADRGRQPVILLGPEEEAWVEQARSALPGALLPLQDPRARAFGPSPLLTIALGRRLSAAVANDSGAGHMLAAADVALVSLFGPSTAEKFAPHVPRARIVRAQGFGPGDAMAQIPVGPVAEALDQLLEEAARQG